MVDPDQQPTEGDTDAELLPGFTKRGILDRFAAFDRSSGYDPVAPAEVLALDERDVPVPHDEHPGAGGLVADTQGC
jgi:hypothetical protein